MCCVAKRYVLSLLVVISMTTLASRFFQSFPLWTFNYEWSTGRTCICPGSFNHFLKSTGGERFGWLIRNMGQHSIHEIQPQTVFSQKLEGANTNQGNLQCKNFSWRYKSLSLWHKLQVFPFTDKTKLQENETYFFERWNRFVNLFRPFDLSIRSLVSKYVHYTANINSTQYMCTPQSESKLKLTHHNSS